METQIVGGLLAFLGGVAISILNYCINRWTLKNKPDALAAMSVVRQLLNLVYLFAVFFLRNVLPWDIAWLLIGAALGLTVPSILLSVWLARQSTSGDPMQENETTEKGEK